MIRVKVLLFAQLRDLCGRGDMNVELPEGARASDLPSHLGVDFPKGLPPLTYAVNFEQAEAATFLHNGDEVALLPPVSGG